MSQGGSSEEFSFGPPPGDGPVPFNRKKLAAAFEQATILRLTLEHLHAELLRLSTSTPQPLPSLQDAMDADRAPAGIELHHAVAVVMLDVRPLSVELSRIRRISTSLAIFMVSVETGGSSLVHVSAGLRWVYEVLNALDRVVEQWGELGSSEDAIAIRPTEGQIDVRARSFTARIVILAVIQSLIVSILWLYFVAHSA